MCILLAESGSAELSQETSRAELLSSVLLMLEARRNLVRLAREGVLDPSTYDACLDRVTADIQQFILRDLTLDLCLSNQLPAVVTPRSLDLAHLRTALSFHSEQRIDRFVSLDLTQRHAARELGLPV